jgi:hypothetical protein
MRRYRCNVRVGARQRFCVFIQFGLFEQSFDDDLVANGVNDRNKGACGDSPQLGRRSLYFNVLNAACTQQHGAAPANKAVSAARVTGFELCPLRVTKMPLICAALVAMTTFSQLNLRQV